MDDEWRGLNDSSYVHLCVARAQYFSTETGGVWREEIADLGLERNVAGVAQFGAELSQSSLTQPGDVLQSGRQDLTTDSELVRLVGGTDVI